MNKLLKDAIADAKAVRETALANAKLALEEAFAPKLQSMLSHKIKEELADEEEEEMPTEEMDNSEEMKDDANEIARMQGLAGISEEDEEEMPPAEEMPTEDEMPTEEMPTEEDEMPAEDDADLEEILRQLEEEEGAEETEEDPTMKDESLFEDEHEEDEMPTEGEEGEDEDEEVNLDELIKSLREGEDGEDEEEAPEEKEEAPTTEAKKMKKKMMETEKELNEAYSAVKYLRVKLNEVNLLNAKLLYVNKLFRKNGLTESQKVKIIETFDRARTVRETKLIYATLAEPTNAAPVKKSAATKTKVMEGFASAASKKTNIITEGNEQVNRFKQLAGIK